MNQCQLLEVLIHDDREPCPYLPGRTARMPLRLPAASLTPRQLDDCLARGDRRSGPFLYRIDCRECRACQPIRLDTAAFCPSRSQRRVWRRGQQHLRAAIGRPTVDPERVRLFNIHRRARGLAEDDETVDESGYAAFLVESCCESLEICYRLGQRLIAVAVCDWGMDSLSAVYCYFDPQYARLSPGTFSILKQVQLCRRWRKRFLYLGLYIAESPHMSYKARFLPHERLVDGRWQRFAV